MNSTETLPKIIRIKKVRELTGLLGGEPYRKSRDPEDPFPASIELGPAARGWYEDEIIEWRNSRPRAVQKLNALEVSANAA